MNKSSAIVKNIATLALLLLLLPFNLTAVILTWIKGIVNSKSQQTAKETKRILITGAKMTKALQLARSFHRDGHEVYLVETHKYWLHL